MQFCSQVMSPWAQLPRQPIRLLQAVSLTQVLYADSQAPPVLRTVFWQLSHMLPPVVPPVEPVLPPVEPVVPPPVVPPPHWAEHADEHDEQTQLRMSLSRFWLAGVAWPA